ncbi:UNVERIFIED_CONTAM: hypothetical protein Sradi_5705400 [Sesamum radiatum]|uniref:Uncharacterized protein n=1 Tax=Sesamum radiatum TaxID=300843 RepID=A0AAW2L5B9_SESRA
MPVQSIQHSGVVRAVHRGGVEACRGSASTPDARSVDCLELNGCWLLIQLEALPRAGLWCSPRGGAAG